MKQKTTEKMFHEIGIISEPNRMRIIKLLQASGKLNVTKIHSKLKMPQNLCSHHLGKLRSCGVAEVKKNGLERIYTINLSRYMQIIEDQIKFVGVRIVE